MRFEGQFKNGKKNGMGRLDWVDGSYYKGNFEEGVFEGQGEYYFAEQEKTYIGDWKNG